MGFFSAFFQGPQPFTLDPIRILISARVNLDAEIVRVKSPFGLGLVVTNPQTGHYRLDIPGAFADPSVEIVVMNRGDGYGVWTTDPVSNDTLLLTCITPSTGALVNKDFFFMLIR